MTPFELIRYLPNLLTPQTGQPNYDYSRAQLVDFATRLCIYVPSDSKQQIIDKIQEVRHQQGL